MPTTIKDLIAAVQATNAVITDPSGTQDQLGAAAETEHETVTAYLDEAHQAAQAERQAQAEAG
jgi:hypothetical protein